MKKKSIKKVLTTMYNVCFKNELCTECQLHNLICLNTEDIDDNLLEISARIIKEIMDNE